MHRSIDCSTWDDPWFTELGPNGKLIFLYLITNRRVNQCGAMEITVRQISFETGMAAAEIPSAIESLGDRVQWWPGSNLLIVRNFYRHQRANTGDKFDVAARKSAEILPDFAREWLYGVYPHLRPEGDTHPIPTPVPPHTHAISGAEAVAGSEAASGSGAEAGDEETPQPPKGESIPPEFVEFWERYPTGFGSKPKTLAAWKKVRKEHAAIMAGLESWHRSERWQKGFIKAADIWLKDRLWENPAPPPAGQVDADAAFEAWKRGAAVAPELRRVS